MASLQAVRNTDGIVGVLSTPSMLVVLGWQRAEVIKVGRLSLKEGCSWSRGGAGLLKLRGKLLDLAPEPWMGGPWAPWLPRDWYPARCPHALYVWSALEAAGAVPAIPAREWARQGPEVLSSHPWTWAC